MEENSVFFIFRGLGCVTFCDSNAFYNTDAVRHFAVLLGRSVGLLPGVCALNTSTTHTLC
jgi:hypothetical protein